MEAAVIMIGMTIVMVIGVIYFAISSFISQRRYEREYRERLEWESKIKVYMDGELTKVIDEPLGWREINKLYDTWKENNPGRHIVVRGKWYQISNIKIDPQQLFYYGC